MKECCAIQTEVSQAQRRVLRVVFWINAVMFGAELVAGIIARSTALVADSVDMLGDALVYGFSLYVVGRGPLWERRAALLKGGIMATFGGAVLVEVVTKLIDGGLPVASLMGSVGLVALVANLAVLVLLWQRRGDDLNMRSVWLCSRNDVIANAGVLVAAGAVAFTASAWPDIIVGGLIAALFVTSAVGVIRDARALAPSLR